MPSGLTRLVPRAQQLLAEVLAPGALAVDLTAGTGRDTLFLAQQVGAQGTVLSFDIQPAALDQTAQLLATAGISACRHPAGTTPAGFGPGVHLLDSGHERLGTFLTVSPRAIIANLGYLPGGDPAVTTLPATTLSALYQGLDILETGGRLAVVLYVAHPGGEGEAAVVERLFATLSPRCWQVLRLAVANLPHAPLLLVAEKKSGEHALFRYSVPPV